MRGKQLSQPTKEEATAAKKKITDNYPTLAGTPQRIDPATNNTLSGLNTNSSNTLPTAPPTAPSFLPKTTELLEPKVTNLPTERDLEDSAIPAPSTAPKITVPEVRIPGLIKPATPSEPKINIQ